MDRFGKQHYILLGVLVVFCLFLLFSYLLFIRPLVLDASEQQTYISEKRAELRKSGWPLVPDRLSNILKMKKLELNGTGTQNKKGSGKIRKSMGIKNKTKAILFDSTDMFREKIKRIFASNESFIDNASLLDYQEEFNKFEQKMATNFIYTSEEVLNIGEDTTSTKMYELILKVWTLDKVTDLVTKNKLEFLTVDKTVTKSESGVSHKVAKLQVLPIRSYYLYTDDEKPYLLEIPVRMTLMGTMEHLNNFLISLQKDGYFIPVSQIEILSLPEVKTTFQNIIMGSNVVLVNIECSAFFRPAAESKEIKLKIKKEVKVIPVGA